LIFEVIDGFLKNLSQCLFPWIDWSYRSEGIVNVDTHSFGNFDHSFQKADFLNVLNKSKNISTGTTNKTFINLFVLGNGKRWIVIVMKRANSP
jgi:hypothetical protein